MKYQTYTHFPRVELPDRKWPSEILSHHPIWCSIDLRSGNDALPSPMDTAKKLVFFHLLVKLGFKEIEIASPAVSEEEFKFTRKLIEENLIPADVTIQVTSQMKPSSIDKTFESIQGCREVIVNLYHTTSLLRRNDVFDTDHEGLIERAVNSFHYAVQLADSMKNSIVHFEYSLEGFNTTEINLAISMINAVIEEVKPHEKRRLIINLQDTVQADLPNVYADQIEYLIKHLTSCEHVIISIQPHNDQGCAVAASELGQLAGAQRIEGCLLGNGERAGTADLIALALNLYSFGIDPGLEINDINEIIEVCESCTGLVISPRHPYAGDLAFASFTAPHQFAVHAGLKAYEQSNKKYWHVPYLLINPQDIGRAHENVIRLTSQSGRSGIAHIMEKFHGYCLPVNMQREFALLVKEHAGETLQEITADKVYQIFVDEYIHTKGPLELKSVYFEKDKKNSQLLHCTGHITYDGKDFNMKSSGNGATDAVVNYLNETFDLGLTIEEYFQHSLSHGSSAIAASYIHTISRKGISAWGAGIDSDATLATLRALISAANRVIFKQSL